MIKVNQLRKKSKSELRKTLGGKGEKLRALRFGLSGGKVKNIREIREIKKDMARILTILKETVNKPEETSKK